MGRNSKLSEAQWADVNRRTLAGESVRSLAREFGVSDAAIRQRLSSQQKQVKAVANQIVAAERALNNLPLTSQRDAQNLANSLRSISDHLASAANYGAATAHRLSGIAHGKVGEIDDAAPLDENSLAALKGIAVLTKMANESSEIGVNLLRANKEHVDAVNAASRESENRKDTGAPLRPQLTREEWMVAHGVGTAAGSAK